MQIGVQTKREAFLSGPLGLDVPNLNLLSNLQGGPGSSGKSLHGALLVP